MPWLGVRTVKTAGQMMKKGILLRYAESPFEVNGNKFDLTGKPAFSLCRCGGSVNKPFCDGTHSKIGFQGAELAVKKAEDAS